MATHKKRRRIPGAVSDLIEQLLVERAWTPGQVHEELARLHDNGQITYLPDLRTVQRYAKELTPDDPSSPWTLTSETAAEAPFVLSALAERIERTQGRRRTVTQREAEMIAAVTRAAPDLDARRAFYIGSRYAVLRREGASTEMLDLYLAFAPWRSPEASERYVRAWKSGWIEEPLWLEGWKEHAK
jgi:hypothetical protein